MVSIEQITEAMGRVRRVASETPLRRCVSLSELAGRDVLVKEEHLQRTGSFKIRGAYNLISRLQPGSSVVAASAGNHGQGVALAARLCGMDATVFMPLRASLPKVEATRAYGATVRLAGDDIEGSIAAAAEHAAAAGAVLVPPFDDELVIAGQGTIGLELARQGAGAEAVVVPVGGGGLVSGVAVALGARAPGTRVIGVQAAGAAAMAASLAAGRPVRLGHVATMADGIAVPSPSEMTLAHVQAQRVEIVTVSEEEISRAIVLLLERAKAVVEPAGAVGLAAVLAGKVPGRGPAVVLASGGNVDPLLLTRLIEHGLSAAGRYLVLRIVLPDHPGSLAALASAVAAMNLNVLAVEHHRSGLDLAVDQVEVMLTLETLGPAHASEVTGALGSAGFTATALS